MTRSIHARVLAATLGLLASALAGGCHGEDIGDTAQPLTAVCVDPQGTPPAGGWMCGHLATVECTTHAGATPDFIYVELAASQSCATETLAVNEPGPFPPGSYTIVVEATVDGGPPAEACSSTLRVVDTVPPEVVSHVVELWPPNHKYHHITIADCVTVTDACDPAPAVWLTRASSDEPDNSVGDGSTTSDIANLGCDGVDLRAERQGTGDGRVYTLGWHAEDHAGNHVEGTCQVVVPHDQGGGTAVDSGVDYQVDLPAGSCP